MIFFAELFDLLGAAFFFFFFLYFFRSADIWQED